MSIIDGQLLLHDDTAVTTATEYKGDSVALREVGAISSEGAGEGLEIVAVVTEAFSGGTSCEFSLVTANDAAITTEVDQLTPTAFTTATLVQGFKVRLPVPSSLFVADADATHFALQLTSVGVHTAGQVTAWVQRVGEHQHTIND